MTLSKVRHLLDVNVIYALLTRDHIHHQIVRRWFYSSGDLQWGLCSFTEAGFLRNATAPRSTQISMSEASAVLAKIKQHPGHRYVPIDLDWHSLTEPFFKHIYGTKQVTDAYLLGLAIHKGLTLVTLDKAILHLADEYQSHVLLLQDTPRAT